MTEAAAGGEARRDPWSRYGWLVWAGWLIFLVFPVIESLAADSVARQVVGLVGTAAFGVVYAGAFLTDGGGSGALSGARRQVAALGLLVLITGIEAVAIGLGAMSFLPFLMAFSMFALPRPANWWFGAVVAASMVVPWAIDPDEGWIFLTFVVVAVGLGTGAGRLMTDQGEHWSRLQEQLAVTAERDRVARDVHDVLGHSLTVVAVKAQLAARLVDADPERAKAELDEVQQLAREALAEIRTTVRGLRSTALEDELLAAADALASAGIAADLPDDPEVLEPRHRTVAAWALREAVTNVVRHSGARRCEVELRADGLSVRDDGRGRGDAGEGSGLRGLRERVAASGGALEVAAGPGGGTALEVHW